MDISALTDEKCGLYFLAGADAGGGGNGGVVTIHAAQGSLDESNLRAIEAAVAAARPGFATRIRLHSDQELRAPTSLESFAARFSHEEILVDPTGSFARVSKLLALGTRIRAEFGQEIGRILWRADTSSLIVLGGKGAGSPELDERLRTLFERVACAELRGVVRSIRLATEVPAGRYTPLDSFSIATRGPRSGLARLFLRLSGAAALLGLGTITAAQAAIPANVEETDPMLPGITGLVGLTTLGESTFGPRNRYQAVGGLRLYFGEAGGILMAALVVPSPPVALPSEAPADAPAKAQGRPAPASAPPKPTRIQYGG